MDTFICNVTFGGKNAQIAWMLTEKLDAISYTCGHCNEAVSANDGYYANVAHIQTGQPLPRWKILICHHCAAPTFFRPGEQVPGPPFGSEVKHLPSDVHELFKQARDCCKVNAYTASVLCCRKLLMHIAVSQKADEGKAFIHYVEYLSANNFVPPGGKAWVDHIRQKGNEANHEIVIMKIGDAEQLIKFIEMLLRFIYEFPNSLPAPAGGPPVKGP
jgi:hypothetical protein